MANKFITEDLTHEENITEDDQIIKPKIIINFRLHRFANDPQSGANIIKKITKIDCKKPAVI